jgi:1-acyl-sn-glycerol-3-phosphate acyltransferase
MPENEFDPPRRPPPRRGLRPRLAALVLRIGGFTPVGDPPEVERMVILSAPHTWWWDGFWMLAFAWYWGLSISWFVKLSSTRGPLGFLPRLLGGIPVDRRAPQGLVGELTRAFAERSKLLLVVPPEGTRARRKYWKSGFYHIARQANVPICLSYLDYGRQRGGFGPCFYLTGDMGADMDRVREFYRDMRGRIPELETPPRLVEEDGPAADPTSPLELSQDGP